MVRVHQKNSKLVERGIRILAAATGLSPAKARGRLKVAGGQVPVALVMVQAGVSRKRAERALEAAKGHVRYAITRALELDD
jgi:N-acetylmuramic acid 6-phosphate etherase